MADLQLDDPNFTDSFADDIEKFKELHVTYVRNLFNENSSYK